MNICEKKFHLYLVWSNLKKKIHKNDIYNIKKHIYTKTLCLCKINADKTAPRFLKKLIILNIL